MASVLNDSEDYSKALKEPLYARIHEVLYSKNESKETLKAEELKNDTAVVPEEHLIEVTQDGLSDVEQNVVNINHAHESLLNSTLVTERKVVSQIEESLRAKELRNYSRNLPEQHLIGGLQDGLSDVEQNVHNVNHASESLPSNTQVTKSNVVNEIEEEQSDESVVLEGDDKAMHQTFTIKTPETHHVNGKTNVSVSPLVQQALETLEKAIYIVREHGFNGQNSSSLSLTYKKPPNMENHDENDANSSEVEVCTTSEKESTEKTGHESRNSTGIQDVRYISV